MFSAGSLEKNPSTLAESHSPGRSKFPIGLNPLGDESQQNNRIQSAVLRYNNSTVGSFTRSINERSIPSPFRHAFLKNAQKFNNFENEKEEAQNSSKKSNNYYQGVGNFPIVHLKKSEVFSRPIRRIVNNEFKIQLPELPFNRFLNQSPNICLDAKTSTRSVLDVLQDLSRKRIHTKDDNEVTKRKCKGLGGDAPLNIEAPYKPLFVPKTKTNAVTLRDSTTQTQDVPPLELSPSKKTDKNFNNKKDDPKAELRRKLARQNNEIFASLSSSTLMYPLKRNSGKLSQDTDSSKQNQQNTKRIKCLFEEKNDKKLPNGDISSKDSVTTNIRDINASKTEKRHRTIDSKLSPNKDRLTTIFLEMQNINPIIEVLTNKQGVSTTDGTEPPKSSIAEKSLDEKSISCENKNNTTDKTDINADGVSVNNTSASTASLVFDNKKSDDKTNFFSNSDNGKKDVSITENNSFSSSVATTSNFLMSTSTTINFGGPSTSPTFKPLASAVSSSITQTPILSTGVPQKMDKFDASSGGSGNANKAVEIPKSDTVSTEGNSPIQKLYQPPTSGSGFSLSHGIGQQATGAGMFKFGTGGANTPLSNTSPSEDKATSEGNKEGEKNGLGAANITNAPLNGFFSNVSSSQLSFLASTTTTTATFSPSQQSSQSFTFSDKLSTAPDQTAEKPAFQFGFSSTSTSNSMPPSLFSTVIAPAKPDDKPATEQKPESENAPKPETSNANTGITSFPPSTLQNNPFSTPAPTFGGQPVVTSAQNATPFKFGEKTETTRSNDEAGVGTNFFDPKKPGLFAFGQKPQVSLGNSSSEQPASQINLFQQSTFSFGQKTATPTSTSSQTSTSSNLFGQSTSQQSSIFQQTGGTTKPTMNTASPFGGTTESSDSLNKPQVPSFIPTTSSSTGIMSTSFAQNKLSAPAFGQSTPSFGQATTNFSGEKNIFGASSSQTTPAFGSTSAVQSGPFSQQQSTTNQSTGFFSAPPATQASAFPSSTGFGAGAFGQTPSAESNLFGQKGGFEQNQNQPAPFSATQPFSSQTGFNFGAATTTSASTGFSMSTSATTAPVFGFGTATKTTPAPSSSFGFSGSSQPESSSQSLFAFNNQSQANTFKFGNAAPKETPVFGNTGSASSTFSFNSTPSTSEAVKPAASVFSFGSPQTTSANTGFNFGPSQTPVFSFGSSSSSPGGSKFSFGATPTGGGIFTPGATPSPSSVPLQGVFSIGSGSSQPRNRSLAARARRRP